MCFQLLHAGLPVQRQVSVTVQIAALTDPVHQEPQLGDQGSGPPNRSRRLQPPSDSDRLFAPLGYGASDRGDVLRVCAQAGRGTRRIRRQLDVPRHVLGGSEEPVTEPRPPASVSRGMFMDMDKDFIGQSAVKNDLEQGVPRYLAGLKLESKRAARAGDMIFHENKAVGEVTSGALAPSLDVAVALALVDEACTVTGSKLEVEVRGKRLPAQVVDLPFYKNGTARKKAANYSDSSA